LHRQQRTMDYKIFLIQMVLVFSQVHGQGEDCAEFEVKVFFQASPENRHNTKAEVMKSEGSYKLNDDFGSYGESWRVWRKESENRFIFNDGYGWKLGLNTNLFNLYNHTFSGQGFFKGKRSLPNKKEETWTSMSKYCPSCLVTVRCKNAWASAPPPPPRTGQEARECFVDKDDPLDVAFTSKYGKFWYNQLYNALNPYVPDPQTFFPNITNQNECRALDCLFLDFGDCGFDEGDCGGEFTHIGCDIISKDDSLGPGCQCSVPWIQTCAKCAKCCAYGNCPDDIKCEASFDITTLASIMARSGGKIKRFRGKK